MPFYRRYFHPGQLQFITTSTYRRAPIFSSDRFRRDFVEVLNHLRLERVATVNRFVVDRGFFVRLKAHGQLKYKLTVATGTCLTSFICSASPNWPEPAATMSLILQRLKDRTARRLLAALRKHSENSCCRKMRARFRLPPSVHEESHDRVWQRRFYPFNVYSEKQGSADLRF